MGDIYANSYYTIVVGPSWTSAKKNAEALGGKLASITNEDESTTYMKTISKVG